VPRCARAATASAPRRAEGGKDIRGPIALVAGEPVSYNKGTIEGLDTCKDDYSNGKGTSYRQAKVDESHGPDMLWEVDHCGAFLAGQLTAGQAVDDRGRRREALDRS
jgi:hypothetical protein